MFRRAGLADVAAAAQTSLPDPVAHMIGSSDGDCATVTLPHHRTCGFPHPAVELSGSLQQDLMA